MARILYYSVHEVLEYDEIKLFRGMGHSVFSLGIYNLTSRRGNSFRPELSFSQDEQDLAEKFVQLGCNAEFNDRNATVLCEEFLDHFDVIIVMHDIYFIAKNWNLFRGRRIVWRTIGQAMDDFDVMISPYRNEGLHIVRWSPREIGIAGYAGHDAIIRGYKDPAAYQEWEGLRSDRFITFASAYKQRYNTEYEFFKSAMDGLNYAIGGGSNETLKGSIGLVDFETQQQLLKSSLTYVYFHGSIIPYTLNFIEAWISGLPVIIVDRGAKIDGLNLKYNEVNDLIVHDFNGFKVKSSQEANDLAKQLLVSRDRLVEISRFSRSSATMAFGLARAQQEWGTFFEALLPIGQN